MKRKNKESKAKFKEGAQRSWSRPRFQERSEDPDIKDARTVFQTIMSPGDSDNLSKSSRESQGAISPKLPPTALKDLVTTKPNKVI